MSTMTQEPRGIHRRTRFELTTSLKARFDRMVDRRGPGECWNWTGCIRNGYGAIKHEGRLLGTHVVAFVASGGAIADGELVVHSCDNKTCCNPAHLSSGTAARNVREMYSRRAVNRTHGQLHPNSVLTDKVVKDILSLRIVRGWGYRRIAKIIKATETAIDNVLRRRNWKHIQVTQEEAVETVRCLGL